MNVFTRTGRTGLWLALICLLGLRGYAQEAGHSIGTASVDNNGAAHYSMPIIVSPGTNGMQPNLAITYSHNGGNGLLGEGFALQGFSMITRVPATLAEDGFYDPVDFDINDRYALDGERLYVVSGTHGADGSRYRTEHESFSRITAYGSLGGEPQYFVVETNDGLIMEFGNSTNSGVEATGKPDILTWRINRMEDRHGNYMTFHYVENNANTESYPDHIEYTGNGFNNQVPYATVSFVYESRNDAPARYVYGSRQQNTKRLKSITSQYGNDTYRTYTLNYEESAGAKLSLLSRIEECGSDGGCYDAVTFDWSEAQSTPSFGPLETWTSAFAESAGPAWVLSEHPREVADVDGDGKMDIVGFGEDGTYLSLSKGDHFDIPVKALSTYGDNEAAGSWFELPRMLADVNGDGQADIVALKDGNVHVAVSTGTGFKADSIWLTNLSYSQTGGRLKGALADVDGNGSADLIIVRDDGVYVATSKGKGFASPSLWVYNECTPGTTTSPIYFADADGDGLTDAIQSCEGQVRVAVSLSYTFSSWQDWLELPARIDQDWSTYSLSFQDMNDDAKADLVRWQENGIHVSLSGEDHFSNPERWLPNFGSQQEWNQYPKCFEDINADNLTDLVIFMEDSVFVGIGTGSKFRKERPFIANFGYNEASLESTRPPVLADADGDGRADIYNFGDHGVEIARSTGIAFETPNVWVSGFSANPEWTAEKHPRDLLDIDADGLPDLVAFGDDGIKIAINNGAGFDRPYLDLPFFGYSDAAGAWRSDKHLRTFGDINGDGYPDLLGSDDNRTYIAMGNGTGFDAQQVAFEGYGASAEAGGWKTDIHQRYLADMTGDGKDDFVAIGAQGVWVGISNGATIATPTQWSTYHNDQHIHRPKYVVDINGDGYADIFDFGYSRIYYSLSTGSGLGTRQTWNSQNIFTQEGSWFNGYYLRQPVDMNGDGLVDVLGISSSAHVSLNYGTQGLAKGVWSSVQYPNVKNLNRNPYFVTDVNGDGFPDVVDMYDVGTYVTLNTGSSLNARVKVTDNMGNDGEGPDYGPWDQLKHSRQVIDVDGDGLPDLVGIGRRGVEVSLNQLHNPWVVTRVNNAGFITEYEYGQLTSDALYTKGNAATFPDNTVQAPITVVKELRASNGIGGMNHHRYTYSNAVFNRQGRGFKGFGGTTHTQVESGIRTESTFTHEPRFAQTPLLRRRQFLTSSDRLISSEVYELQSRQTAANKVQFSFASKITRQTYDPSGNSLSSESEQYEYDSYGNLTYYKRIDGGTAFQLVYTDYFNDPDLWLIGRKTREKKEYYQQGSPSESIEIAYAYSNDWHLLVSEIREPNRNIYKLSKNYSYDAFGNLERQEIIGDRGTGNETRSTLSTYDPQGRFILTATNEMSHSSSYSFDPVGGNILSVTGPNGLTTETQYDGFGRPVLQIAPDGLETRYRYEPVRSGNNSYRVTVQAEGRPEYQTWYDYKDRIVCKAWTGYGGKMVYEKVQFNTEGQLDRVSEPHYSGENIRWTRYDYDPIGRVIRESAADNSSQQISYDGLVKTTLNQLGQTLTEEYNKRGQLLSKTDHLNNTTSFAYSAMGRLITVTDVAGNQIQTTYDPLGRKLSVSDPDLGLTQYGYNAFGEMISAVNARGKETLYDYDKLGRLTARQIEEGSILFEYDNAPNGIGKLSREIADYNGFEKRYVYDDWGRLAETIHVDPDGTGHRMQHRRNSLGQETELIYPSGFRVLNRFDEWGYLTEVLKEEDLSVYWQAGSYNAQGQSTSHRYGNGLETHNSYDAYRGWLTNTFTAGLQNLSFTYDPLGNLSERSDDRQGLRETFEYDGLNRLIESKVRNQNAVMLTYDALGNITYKSDVGCYKYVGARPHAVRTIKDANGQISREYLYDAAGNMIQNHDISMGYTSFNKVRSLSRGADAMYFNYGAANELLFQRIEQNGSQVSSKRFIDRIYELEQFSDGSSKATHYILANGVAVATHETTSTSTVPSTRYLHRDHLGSLSAISDGRGNFVERVSFDPWGKRRDAGTWAAAANVNSSMDRGFTGHEHLAPFHLIHMGGRVYDPIIGRFTSPDPFVQQAEGQNLNRYSYVLNNPLSFTDPSGFFFKKLFRSIKRFVKKVVKAVVNVVKSIVKNPLKVAVVAAAAYFGGIGLTYIAGIYAKASFFTSSVMTAAYGGFTGGVASGLINGQSLGEAVQIGLSGAFVAGLTAGAVSLTQGFMPSWAKSVQVDKPFGHDALRRIKSQLYHMTFKSTVKGIAKKLTGGKFEDGFYSTFASDLIKWGRNAYVEWQLMKSPMWTGQGLKDGETPYPSKGRKDIYDNMMATLRPSNGIATTKPAGQFAVYGEYQNIGMPNDEHITLPFLENIKFGNEGAGPIMNIVTHLPGMNSMSVHHDAFATAMWNDDYASLSNIISKTTIPPYIVLEYAALKNDTGQ